MEVLRNFLCFRKLDYIIVKLVDTFVETFKSYVMNKLTYAIQLHVMKQLWNQIFHKWMHKLHATLEYINKNKYFYWFCLYAHLTFKSPQLVGNH